ncbi:MAG: PD40 domain-containing protein, partial [Anaerolineales bacterium]|nr:PD40 domain-containing protein [Anaerolineales bacterium]
RLKPAPPEMTFAPITVLPTVNASATETGGTTLPVLSNVTTLHGFTFQLDNVVELEDGFVFTGNLSWDDSAFPSGKGMVAEPLIPILTDADEQRIPIEEVRLDAPYDEFHAPWSYRTNRKAFSGPLTLSVPFIKTNIVAQPVDFEIDFGPNPQVGQSAEVNRDFMVEGHTIRLLSVGLIPAPDSCQGMMVDFKFSTDAPNISADVKDSVPSEPMICSGGGGGSGGPVDLTVFNVQTTYKDMPTGVRRFSFEFWIPYEVSGPWQAQWNPPLSSEPIPTPQAGACLTLEKWNQLASQDGALLSGVDGKIVVTINEGGVLPAIYVGNPNGIDLQKIAIGAWPSLSNDGTQLVYSAQDGLHVVNLPSGQNSVLGVDGYRIIWSPDDTRWMFTNTFSIYVVNADGSGLQKMNIPSGQVLAPVGLLPDNQTIVYSALSGDGFNLKTYNLQSNETKDLFTIHNKAGYGAISPDGQWIVFADRQFGETNWGIYISRLDGSERKLVVEPEVPTAFMSVWGPNGQWLVVNARDANDKNIPILVNPFTCEMYPLNQVDGMVEGWSR